MKPIRSAARALLGAIFVYTGARAVADPDRLVPQAKRVTDRVTPLLEKADARLPTETRTLVTLNGAAQLAGGLMLATGHLTRPAAGLLAGSLLPTTVAAHPFWAAQDAAERRDQRVDFLKNLGLLGGLLLAAADTEGRPGWRWRADRFVSRTRQTARRSLRTARREARLASRAVRTGRRLAR
ncbi:MAG TPA: DoxX family protein [Pilimelia sp.]|nr:DoxX family protein [Pilimelia sp.]